MTDDAQKASPDVEAMVSSICAKVLGVPDLQPDSDIFDLGADSIHVTQIAARLHDAWRIEVTYPEIFEASTVARISALVNSRLSK
ncbi:MAG TPA: phosphopantetheine-binding protein [Bryobacteraceae bacterium]|jgi:acyl carrier protein|nr:phosphopantetheine-binding protein [Bryobacteraceae bacterium]